MKINFNQIISTKDAKDWLESSVDDSVKEVIICSAYIKLNSLEYFYNNFLKNKFIGKCSFLSRWLPGDLAQGSSDLECYTFLAENKIPLYIKNDFHGKIYYISNKGLLMGSPNLTSNGLGLNKNHNDETGVILEESISNYKYIQNIFQNSCRLDDVLFKKIKDFLNETNYSSTNSFISWNEVIHKIISNNQNDNYFSIDEWFFSNGLHGKNKECLNHDYSLMGINNFENKIEILREAFILTKPYQWLIKTLKNNNLKLNFGGLSSKLHDVIHDVPPPLRKDIKILLSNLLSWIRDLQIIEISIEQPNVSQIITLNVE